MSGERDYATRTETYHYRDLFPDSRLLLVEDAGHMLFGGQPECFSAAVGAFLLDEPLPIPVYTDSLPPVDG
jgi:pimeloyl-ACP methyl ester carboxylesterase